MEKKWKRNEKEKVTGQNEKNEKKRKETKLILGSYRQLHRHIYNGVIPQRQTPSGNLLFKEIVMLEDITLKGDSLVITIGVNGTDVNTLPVSKSGKSKVVASTNGFASTLVKGLGQVSLNLNVIAKL